MQNITVLRLIITTIFSERPFL